MITYRIWGWAVVFDTNGQLVKDLDVAKSLADFVDEDDLFATDFIGSDCERENAIAAAMNRSGLIRFEFDSENNHLRIHMDFECTRELSDEEINWLKKYCLGQWSDGMGEGLFIPDGKYMDYSLQALSDQEVNDQQYPYAEVLP